MQLYYCIYITSFTEKHIPNQSIKLLRLRDSNPVISTVVSLHVGQSLHYASPFVISYFSGCVRNTWPKQNKTKHLVSFPLALGTHI